MFRKKPKNQGNTNGEQAPPNPITQAHSPPRTDSEAHDIFLEITSKNELLKKLSVGLLDRSKTDPEARYLVHALARVVEDVYSRQDYDAVLKRLEQFWKDNVKVNDKVKEHKYFSDLIKAWVRVWLGTVSLPNTWPDLTGQFHGILRADPSPENEGYAGVLEEKLNGIHTVASTPGGVRWPQEVGSWTPPPAFIRLIYEFERQFLSFFPRYYATRATPPSEDISKTFRSCSLKMLRLGPVVIQNGEDYLVPDEKKAVVSSENEAEWLIQFAEHWPNVPPILSAPSGTSHSLSHFHPRHRHFAPLDADVASESDSDYE